eukprot:m.183284 g.183284  ORF g.183284 m.183284 type:complete len:412 (+) comp10491_c1_seq5:1036-2271(+)
MCATAITPWCILPMCRFPADFLRSAGPLCVQLSMLSACVHSWVRVCRSWGGAGPVAQRHYRRVSMAVTAAEALARCREFLPKWRHVAAASFTMTRITGGLSNYLFLCETTLPEAEPSRVLLRVYAGVGLCDRTSDVVVCAVLGATRIGPEVLGIFDGGRLEEYIPSRTLSWVDLPDADISQQIAQATAAIHKLRLPIPKKPDWLRSNLTTMLANARKCDAIANSSVQTIMNKNLEAELAWLLGFLEKTPHKLRLCHNDLQEGNVLLLPDGSVRIIDYEYLAYCPREFDIGNHFCEWTINNQHKEPPFFAIDSTKFPTREQRAHFVRAYLTAFYGQPPTKDRVEQVADAAQRFALASHFLYFLWGILHSDSGIDFDYFQYSAARYDCYKQLKAHLLRQKPPGTSMLPSQPSQ